MWEVAGEVLKVIEALGIRARPLTPEEGKELWGLVAVIYAGGNTRRFMWERLLDATGVQFPEGWRRLADFLGTAPALLLFDPHDEKTYFEFDSGVDIPRVIEECFGFEFYVTDRQTSFLLCFNHHDFLIGAGAARAWVAGIKAELS
jgi:hypothetical protein